MQGKHRNEVKNLFVDPLKNRNIGRRTGVDVKAGKTIRKDDQGFEVFDDYWTESENESVCASPSKRGSVASFIKHPLSSNRDHAQTAIKSMSPFAPSSTENSGAITSLNRKHANQGNTNGAALNYDGEVLGTITRVDNTDSAEALKNQAKPCSALHHFKMKKRLRYSEALRKSGETASGPDQLFAVPQKPPRPRQSIAAAQGTPPYLEALPIGTFTEDADSGSVPSSQETAASQGSSDANLEVDATETNDADDSRKVTLKRSGRMSKSTSETSLANTDVDSSRKRQERSRMESNSRATMSPVNTKSAGTKAALDLPRRTRSGRLLQSPTDEANVSSRSRRRSCSAQASQRHPSETVSSHSEHDMPSSSSQGSEISVPDTEDSRGCNGHSGGVDKSRHNGDDTENSRSGRGRSRSDAGYSVGDTTRHGGDTMHSPADITRSEGDTRHNTVEDSVGDAEGSVGDTRHSPSDTTHSASDTRRSASDTRQSAANTRQSASDNDDDSSETGHHLMDAEHTDSDTVGVASVHDVSVDAKLKAGASSEVGMDTLDFLSDSSSQPKKASGDQVNVSVVVEQMSDDTADSDTGGDEQSIDDGGVAVDDNVECSTDDVKTSQSSADVDDNVECRTDDVKTSQSSTDVDDNVECTTDDVKTSQSSTDVDDNVECTTDDVKTSQSSADVDDDGSHRTGATRDGTAGKTPGVVHTNTGCDQRSLHPTPSALSINADCGDDELSNDESTGVVSPPQATPADRLTETHAAPDHDTCASDGETSEDFEITEPCFRVFGVQKRSSLSSRSAKAKSDVEGDSCAQKDETKVKSILRKRARKTTGKKTTKKVKSATQKKVKLVTPSPGVIGRELEVSRQETVGQNVKGKRTQKAKECVPSTETPVVPSQQLGSMRRKINLSPPVQSPYASVQGSPVVDTSLSPGSSVSAGDVGDTPQDEASRHEATSSGDASPHPHPKVTLAMRKSLSPTSIEQGSIPDGENEGDASGKRKTPTPRTRKGCSSEKKKRRASKSPKHGRISASQLLSEDEEESAPGNSIESPRLVLSFNEGSPADTTLSGASPDAASDLFDISDRMPSPILAVTPAAAKGKGARRRRSSSPWLKPEPAKRRKSPSLLRKALMPRKADGKRRKSMFALTPVVMPSQRPAPPAQDDSSNSSTTGLKSILKKTVRYSTGTPVHYFETTKSAVTPMPTSQPTKNVKIIVPDDADDTGCRRSKRTRVLPLDWFRNERILYERRKSGGFAVAGIVSPPLDETKPRKRPKKKSPKRSLSRKVNPETPRNMSIHRPLPDMCELVGSTEISVVNPDTEEEVYVECVKSKDAFNFCGPSGKPANVTDPLILCKALNQKAFSIGQLVLRPLQEKGTHYVRLDTMVFVIKQGKLAVTIHKTTSVLETGDVFFVPQGNTYNLTNLRDEEAKVWFFQLKQ